MYQIIKDGTVLAVCEALVRAKRQKNGFIVPCETGGGLLVNGVPYNLDGCDTVAAEYFDGAARLTQLEQQLTDTQLALCEIYEGSAE